MRRLEEAASLMGMGPCARLDLGSLWLGRGCGLGLGRGGGSGGGGGGGEPKLLYFVKGPIARSGARDG
jgi:hypothetical protein